MVVASVMAATDRHKILMMRIVTKLGWNHGIVSILPYYHTTIHDHSKNSIELIEFYSSSLELLEPL